MLALVAPIPSAAAQPSGTPFVFEGRGWGHGVGMSQNGARNMALAGHDHMAILDYYYPNTVVVPTGRLGDIRVHIGDAPSVTMSSADSITFERNGTAINGIGRGSIDIQAHDGGLQIGDVWTPTSSDVPIMVSFPQPVKLANNGHRYLWGKMQLTNRNGKVRVVEVLDLEAYVQGISEMPAAWPREALMAQAIAARTYAHEVTLHRRASDEWEQEYDISATTLDQNYIGYDAQDGQFDQIWLAAAKATAGVEIVDSNGPIRAYYSASNGGYTETAEYVFNNDVPYTVAGPDNFDAGGHNWSTWKRTYSQSAITRWLNDDPATAVGTVEQINVLGGAGASARIDRSAVEIVGSDDTVQISGKKLMLVINAGVFGEGLGLSDHLPGTFTTVGNGVGAGLPNPSGIAEAGVDLPGETDAADAGDEVQVASPESGAGVASPITPPPGWTPEPGTGIDPIIRTPSAESPSRPVPPPGWTPEPGTGIDPIRTGDTVTPPPGWTPEPGTGIDPIRVTPPPGWTPEPGTGIDPIPVNRGASADAPVETVPSEFADFEVVLQPDELADEARDRLAAMQGELARSVFAGFDLDEYIESVAPRTVRGVCATSADGLVVCLPVTVLRWLLDSGADADADVDDDESVVDSAPASGVEADADGDEGSDENE